MQKIFKPRNLFGSRDPKIGNPEFIIHFRIILCKLTLRVDFKVKINPFMRFVKFVIRMLPINIVVFGVQGIGLSWGYMFFIL